MLNHIIKFFLENKPVTVLLTVTLIAWGVSVAPFNWQIAGIPRDPVPVDAIPDIGENQQIVFTEWPGRSPQDVDNQITYPLTTALLGIPGVKTIRGNSIFGLSSIYLIFDDDVDFYWSRSRILEKLNSLPVGTVPDGVRPALGPDATALGQVFWYTLEGRDNQGNPTGGWDPQELRSVQDYYVKYGLSAAAGVSEVASIGGYVKEYQVDVDPVAMKSYGVDIAAIMNAVKKGNLDVGARTIEFNRAEYLVRGLGYIKNIHDLEESVIVARNNIPVRIKDVARVQLGPATRRGGLDKAGAEAVGAVVVARYGSNPMEVINNVKAKISEISPGLPTKTLADGTISKVTVIPFYDRSGLIMETLGTLEEALTLEILVSLIVVIILVLNLRASILISSLLPIGVLMTFVAMRYLGVAANIVALSGIAIAIGVMVDVGIVFTENIVRHLRMPDNEDKKGHEKREVIYEATKEVASAVITALATTVVSFLPVFALQAQEGKLFGPLAFTKTFALLAALFFGLVVIPAFAHSIFSLNFEKGKLKKAWNVLMVLAGIPLLLVATWAGIALIAIGINNFLSEKWPAKWAKWPGYINMGIPLIAVLYLLSKTWLPLGAGHSGFINFIFVTIVILIILLILLATVKYYSHLLRWCLNHKWSFLSMPLLVLLLGVLSWQGFDKVFGFIGRAAETINWNVRQTGFWAHMENVFPGVGKEFMPPLDEGSYLLMPTNMPHSGVSENVETIQLLDQRVTAIPEVDLTVGKWGRVASALDPAPISMFENTVNYKPEYILDQNGRKLRFRVNDEQKFVLKDGETFDPETDNLATFDTGQLIEDRRGKYFRQWRTHIQSPEDIWNEIVKTTNIPGMTSAPRLQPIATRLIMLSTGMRAPIGMKIFGPDLATIEAVGLQMEELLKQVPGVEPSSVFADRVVGKPYLEININRRAIARYGLSIEDMQTYLGVAIGGNQLTSTVEGRERYPVRVRYARELRNNPNDLKDILIPTPAGMQVPLEELAQIQYVRGPQHIKSEHTFLVSYVILDKLDGYAEVDVVENALEFLSAKLEDGSFVLPPGVSYQFAGNYESQVRATNRLAVVIPISLLIILMILYFQFGKLQPALMVFSGVFVAFAGGFILIWLYGQEWFLNFSLFGEGMRDLFQVSKINLSVAVWVGFIALFGVASDNGVLMTTYLNQTFQKQKPNDTDKIRRAVLHAGRLRIKPAMMTTATTMIALLPIFTATGKGSDIMIPMSIPIFGGMVVQVITVFIVPVLYCMWQEYQLKGKDHETKHDLIDTQGNDYNMRGSM
ncbi:efflux RND transporter permease subunit [Fulvivirgaceae bacterium BMA12]|uniref:Efflux RND transporter permease subunit n=1 Tax=Agaribacillus aureus TaxID=3051825 RepID=A0ABT8LA01_9BACT|nr:efflux RND transporter permease subunit [Fulvivirgaceae bacterium BMA12]